MKTLWIGVAVSLASPLALAQTTIYKHVDVDGRVTYSNRPMKDAIVVELEPLSTIPGFAGATRKGAEPPAPSTTGVAPAVAVVTPAPRARPTTVASIDRETQKGRDEIRRQILKDELAQEEKALESVRQSLLDEQRNPTLIAAVRVAQAATNPSPAEQAQMRAAIDKASGRIRGLQATAAEHEKNIEALKKELGAPKP